MTRQFLTTAVLIAIAGAGGQFWASGSEGASKNRPQPDRAKAEADQTRKMIRTEVARWECFIGAKRDRRLQLEKKPLLRWSNPAVGRCYGDVRIATVNGRPEAIFCIYKWFEPYKGFEAEMHSLSASKLTVVRDGQMLWRPNRAGVKMRDVPGAPSPAPTPRRRLVQMRSMAREFAAYLTDRRADRKGQQQVLRLLTQPIHRYGTKSPDVVDGAIFSFVLATDPEVILLLEAPSSGSERQWKYGLARMNRDELWATHKKKEIWRVPSVNARDDKTAPYYLHNLPYQATRSPSK